MTPSARPMTRWRPSWDWAIRAGPIVDRLHAKFLEANGSDAKAVEFPRPFLKDRPYAFSFSGLKTAVLNYQKKRGLYLSDRNLPPWRVPRKCLRRWRAPWPQAFRKRRWRCWWRR